MTKRLIAYILPLVCTFGVVRAQQVWDGSSTIVWEGDGTVTSPYLIKTAEELAGLAQRTNSGETFENTYFTLVADLWLSDAATPDEDKPLWEPIGLTQLINGESEQNPGGFWREDYCFKGNFDGSGHTIHNLWYAHDSEFEDNFNDPFNDGTYDFEGWYRALFGNIEDATVTNLNLSNVSILSQAYGAGLVCTAKNSTITGISVDGFIQCGTSETAGGSAAGIVTEAEGCIFEDCHSSATVKCVSNAGALAGLLKSSTVTGCTASGRIGAMRNAGGLIGVVQEGSVVYSCSSSAEVTQFVAKRQGSNIGGFCGIVSGGVVRNCSSTGNLFVDFNGAGFVGAVINDGLVESSYAICEIKKDGYAVNMASFAGVIGDGHLVGEEPVVGYVRNCYGVAKYYYEPTPDDVVTMGNHIGGFMNTVWEGSQVTNCFYNAETATGINTWTPVDGEPQALEIEFGVTTAYMQSEAFAVQLNEMAGVLGTSLWTYNSGKYPVPTGEAASASLAPFSGGNGTEVEPWVIASKDDLFKVAEIANHGWDFRGQYLQQDADIALNLPFEEWGEHYPDMWTPIGEYYPSGKSFSFGGTYDGALHKVENLYLDHNVYNYAGLIGVVGDGAVIKNLGVTDVYMDCGTITAGILVGSAALWNDECDGERRISNCWTSGHIEGSNVSAFIGGGSQWGKTIMENCYTTAEIYSYSEGGGFFAMEVIGDMPIYLTSSYFNGSFVPNGYGRFPGLFNECILTNCFFSFDGYPVDGSYDYYSSGRTSEYMTTPEFVNELSYASAFSGLQSPWRYSEGRTASFYGEAPQIDITFDIDEEKSISFKALAGSYLTAPALVAPADNMHLNGWINTDTSGIFDFANNPVSNPLTLAASWSEMLIPDYTPFKNKFSKTYTIKTPEQLLALSYILRGLSDEVEQTDYEGYTIQLGNDIEWNDTADFDCWGESWTPMPFIPIGYSSKSFSGTFDGQGHRIKGLYMDQPGQGSSYGMFADIPVKAVVKNLILDKAYIQVGYSDTAPAVGMLAGGATGEVYRCGVESGKIVVTQAAQDEGMVGGLIGASDSYYSSLPLIECYADVTASLKKQGFGGLIYSTGGDVENCYAKSWVKWEDWAWFGGVACIQQRETQLHNCWATSEIEWSYTKDMYYNPGGAVYGSDYVGNTGTYYNATTLGEAFGPKSEWAGERYDPYMFGTGLEEAYMKRMESFVTYDFNEVWGRRNDINGGYPYLRWTSPGLTNDDDSVIVGVSEISEESEVKIYSQQGHQVFKGKYSDANLTPGLYIVTSGDTTIKTILR